MVLKSSLVFDDVPNLIYVKCEYKSLNYTMGLSIKILEEVVDRVAAKIRQFRNSKLSYNSLATESASECSKSRHIVV